MNPVRVGDIQEHYDKLTSFYCKFWGDHIHHGFWENDETRQAAQVKLVERLAGFARVPPGSEVLDVGSGVGGSSRWLAKNLGCRVLGITLSPVQVALSKQKARRENLAHRVDFLRMDADHLAFAPERFGVVWALESSEHFRDKKGFLKNCFPILKPGGILAVAAWLKNDSLNSSAERGILEEICSGMLLPSLGSLEEYKLWLSQAGFKRIRGEDITPHIERTWHLCGQILEKPFLGRFLRAADEKIFRFAQTFPLMREAYRRGILGYGFIAAVKESAAGEV